MRIALQLQALLAQRPGELRHAEWTEIDFATAVWTIPADRMKMRRPQTPPRSVVDGNHERTPLRQAGVEEIRVGISMLYRAHAG